MLNILQIEDRLKDMSQDAVMEALNNPNPVIPPFMALAELNRRKRMNDDLAMRQAQNQQTVKDQVIAGAGMPMEMTSDMATAMAPKSDIAGNTGLEAMMQSNTLPSEYNDDIAMMDTEFEDEPMEMASGGLIDGGPNKAVGGAFLSPIFSGIANVGSKLLPRIPKAKPTGTSLVPYNRTQVGPYLGKATPKRNMLGLAAIPATLSSLFMFGDDEEEEKIGDEQGPPYIPPEEDDPVTQPPPDTTYAPSYIPQLMQQLQEDREALKAGRDQDMGLALMTAGLNIADRGQLSAGVAGVEQLAQANQAYRENLRNLSGLGVQAGVAGDTLMQKAMQARMSYDKSIELAKMLGAGDLIKGIGTIGDQMALIESAIQLGVDENEEPLSPERTAMLKAKREALSEIYNMLIARTQGELGKNVIASP
jgi:hypothetical protein